MGFKEEGIQAEGDAPEKVPLGTGNIGEKRVPDNLNDTPCQRSGSDGRRRRLEEAGWVPGRNALEPRVRHLLGGLGRMVAT